MVFQTVPHDSSESHPAFLKSEIKQNKLKHTTYSKGEYTYIIFIFVILYTSIHIIEWDMVKSVLKTLELNTGKLNC